MITFVNTFGFRIACNKIVIIWHGSHCLIDLVGKFVNHKGRNRHFTSPEELEEERKAEEKKKWRKKKEESGDESGSDEEEEAAGSNDSEESESEEEQARGGAHGLIEIENPNRIPKKQVLKVSTMDLEGPSSSSSAAAASSAAPAPVPELSRREREEIEKQKKAANYQRLHAQGKTEQAKADLARLAIIKQQREEAQKQRELKNKEKDAKAAKSGK